MIMLGVHSGSIRDNFIVKNHLKINSVSFWDNFGVNLGKSRDNFGVNLERSRLTSPTLSHRRYAMRIDLLFPLFMGSLINNKIRQ